jgi:hypothetical protein
MQDRLSPIVVPRVIIAIKFTRVVSERAPADLLSNVSGLTFSFLTKQSSYK